MEGEDLVHDAGRICPVQVLQNPRELARLVEIFRRKKPRAVLEIGSMYGGTLWHWIINSEPGTRIVSVDVTVPETDERYGPVTAARRLWPRWAVQNGIDLVAIEGSSQDPNVKAKIEAALWEGVDFAFIDGDHSHTAVLEDYHTAASMLNPAGVMAFHDIATLIPRAWSTVQLDARIGRTEEIIQKADEFGIGVAWWGEDGA